MGWAWVGGEIVRQQQIRDGFYLLVKATLPRHQPLAVEQVKALVAAGGGHGQVHAIQSFHEPFLEARHDNFLCTEFLQYAHANRRLVIKRKRLSVDLVADDEE